MEGTTLKFSYWPFKGLAEPCRFVLAYLGIKYEEVNPESRDVWNATDKIALKAGGLAFPNLPYIIDGDYKLSESGAIPFYLAHKAGKPELTGKCYKDQATVKQLEGVVRDIFSESKKVFAAKTKEEAAESLTKILAADGKVCQKFQGLSDFLAEKDFLLGYLTTVDIEAIFYIQFVDLMARSAGIESPVYKNANLKALVDRVLALPGIKEYVATDNYKRCFIPPAFISWILVV